MTVSLDGLRNHLLCHNKQNSWWLNDVKGIPVSRVCDECIEVVKSQYDPAIFGEGSRSYEEVVDEPIEPEEY